MNILSQIKVWLEQGEEILTYANRTITFGLMIQNIEQTSLPRIYINLIGPAEVRILIKKRELASISPGKTRKVIFRIRPKQNGVFTLTAIIRNKIQELAKVPFTLRVGMTPQIQQSIQQPIVNNLPKEEKVKSVLNCPICGGKLGNDAKFCPMCGNVLNANKKSFLQDDKTCPNCNNIRSPQARYCGYCGWDLV